MSYIYFDNAASTLPLKESFDIFFKTESENYANSSSVHPAGQKARELLENARDDVFEAFKLDHSFYRVVFTSCASESNNIVMQSVLKSKKPAEVLISAAEHKSIEANVGILKSFGHKCIEIPSHRGIVSGIADKVNEKTKLASIIHTNNITGAVNDIASLSKEAKSVNHDMLFHSDMTQSITGTALDFPSFQKAGIDAFSFSSHKSYAPKGSGLLIVGRNRNLALSPAGGQEFGFRGGTQSLGLILSFVNSLKYIRKNAQEINGRFIKLRELMFSLLRDEKKITVLENTVGEKCSSIICLSVSGLPGEVCQRILAEKGFIVGTTSACSSNAAKGEKNILKKMGFAAPLADSAVRISFGIYNTEEEVRKFAAAFKEVVAAYI